MKILIYGKREFNKMMDYKCITDENAEEHNILIISISSPKPMMTMYGFDEESAYFKENHANVLNLKFGDYSQEAVELYPQNCDHIFSEDMANQVIDHIIANKDKPLAIIHCGAGISRSGAIGTFLFDRCGDGDYDAFKRKNPRITPNQHVLKTLDKVANKKQINRIKNES